MRFVKTVQRALALALEEASTGAAVKEVEHVLYARLEDMNVLEGADAKEHQEQWEIKIAKTELNGSQGTSRVRKTVVEGHDPEYVLTMKTPATDKEGRIEVSIPATEAMFVQFRMLSEMGMVKDRYTFNIEGSDLKWEVDVFYKKGAQVGSGDYEPWVKIDLEVPDLSAPLPPLPEGFTDIIVAPYGKRSEAEEARVSALYKNEFLTPNPYV